SRFKRTPGDRRAWVGEVAAGAIGGRRDGPRWQAHRHHKMARAGGQFWLRRAGPAVLCCAHTSVYTLRVKVPGNPHPWYRLRGQSVPEDTMARTNDGVLPP